MMFSKIEAKNKSKQADQPTDNIDLDDIPDIDDVLAKGTTSGKSSKKLSVERIYQKKTQLEHILLRPDTYIGSVEHITQVVFVIDWTSSLEMFLSDVACLFLAALIIIIIIVYRPFSMLRTG